MATPHTEHLESETTEQIQKPSSATLVLGIVLSSLVLCVMAFAYHLLTKKGNSSQSSQNKVLQQKNSSLSPTIGPTYPSIFKKETGEMNAASPVVRRETIKPLAWSSYKNQAYGYAIEYPSELELTGFGMGHGENAWFGTRINLLYAFKINYFQCQTICEMKNTRKLTLGNIPVKYTEVTIKESEKISDHYLMYQYNIGDGYAYLFYNYINKSPSVINNKTTSQLDYDRSVSTFPLPSTSETTEPITEQEEIAIYHQMAMTFRNTPVLTPDPHLPIN